MKKGVPIHIPTARECAITLLLLIGTREKEGKPTNRIRVSPTTLERLWMRHMLKDDLIEEVQEWMLRAGWCLFFAGETYAVVRTSAVINWPRLSSKRLDDERSKIERGEFDFD